jgi:hypothetical protein
LTLSGLVGEDGIQDIESPQTCFAFEALEN